ncbi:DUF202 domain-containing protein [Phytomonospora sp. NPDC050363]|uniref:YidH family protein n=1 Tax=Phytomonospora sp. NPDC050363 TaxID=3155642 RepID=UPI0033F8A7B1
MIKLWFRPERLNDEGTAPDYRFSLANERTFLAWIRTALALIAGGIAMAQFLSAEKWGALRDVLAVGLIAVGAACALRAVSRWLRCEWAMRHGRDLPPTRFPAALAIVITIGAVAVLVYITFTKAP